MGVSGEVVPRFPCKLLLELFPTVATVVELRGKKKVQEYCVFFLFIQQEEKKEDSRMVCM